MRSDNLRSAPHWITPDLVKRVLNIAMPVGGEPMPVRTAPMRGEKPVLAIVETSSNPPVASTHSRRAEESEAAATGPTLAASPPRRAPASQEQVKRHLGNLASHAAQRSAETAARLEAERPIFQIAYDRGIAIADLARTLGQNQHTVSLHLRMAGLTFGRRQLLADPLTREKLLALADPDVPLPELRTDRMKRERLDRWNKIKRNKRAADVARRKAERAAAAELRRVERERAREDARHTREIERAARIAAKVAEKSKTVCEVEPRRERQPVRSAPSREPAVHAAPQPRAQSNQAVTNARRSAAIKRSIERKAIALLDGDNSGLTTGGQVNQCVAAAAKAILGRREAEARRSDPVERAKLVLQRAHYAPVCSMAIYDGDPDLFIVGSRKNITRDELIAWAERIAA